MAGAGAAQEAAGEPRMIRLIAEFWWTIGQLLLAFCPWL